jgi:hypothetical protein
MFTVKRRVYGKAVDGRTILLYAPGMTISDDAAKAAGLLAGAPSKGKAAKGLTILGPVAVDDAPQAQTPLARMNLAELRATCEAEGIDAGDANLRAEYIAVVEAARAAKATEASQEPDPGASTPPEGSAPGTDES